jgi:Ca2+-binding RTX toxin-like protein
VSERRRILSVNRGGQPWNLEQLEARRLMSVSVQHGILVINGTSGDDRIYLEQESGGVCVRGYSDAFADEILNPIMGLRGVRVEAGDGNDSVIVNDFGGSLPFDLPVTLIGGAGNDSLQGGGGDDVLIGGAGDDLLDGRGGHNSLDGPASPLAWASLKGGVLTITGTKNDDVIELDYNGGSSRPDYSIRINGEYVPYLDTFGAHRVVIEGLGGNDTIHVDEGNLPATVYGGAGDDSIYGSGQSDVLIGGSGRDMIFADMSKTGFLHYWQYQQQDQYPADPEQFIDRTDGMNRFNDGAGNDVLEGEGPDQYMPPAPTPAPAPTPDSPSETTTVAVDPAPVDAQVVEDVVMARASVVAATAFSTNPLLISDKALWDI